MRKSEAQCFGGWYSPPLSNVAPSFDSGKLCFIGALRNGRFCGHGQAAIVGSAINPRRPLKS